MRDTSLEHLTSNYPNISSCRRVGPKLFFLLFQMETSAQEVHENSNSIIDYQTHHRLRETQVN